MDCTFFLFLAAEIHPSACEIVILHMFTKERVLQQARNPRFLLVGERVGPWLGPAKENVLGRCK